MEDKKRKTKEEASQFRTFNSVFPLPRSGLGPVGPGQAGGKGKWEDVGEKGGVGEEAVRRAHVVWGDGGPLPGCGHSREVGRVTVDHSSVLCRLRDSLGWGFRAEREQPLG